MIVDQPVDSGMNGGDVQVNSQSNQPPTVAALPTNGTLSANGIEQDENSAIATIQTEALVSEIHAATSALIVGEQAIPLAVELADEAQESNTDNIAVSSSNTATDVGVGEPQSLSTDIIYRLRHSRSCCTVYLNNNHFFLFYNSDYKVSAHWFDMS